MNCHGFAILQGEIPVDYESARIAKIDCVCVSIEVFVFLSDVHANPRCVVVEEVSVVEYRTAVVCIQL
ncbi:hypothetical protein DF118_01590 [Burkholderia stagnalis]|nr:hypothetical protein DF118_01590 [Burkholderia stagnalis]RQY73095.1 hypothetical protein DF110_05975 [Burkholderia stagnalis]RQY92027.1 hypothetical protein DF108_01590 [Burkholderia stagnalis]